MQLFLTLSKTCIFVSIRVILVESTSSLPFPDFQDEIAKLKQENDCRYCVLPMYRKLTAKIEQ